MTNRLSALRSQPGLFAAFIFSFPQLEAKPAAGSSAERVPGAKGNSEQITSPYQEPQGLAKSDWQSIRAAHKAWEHSFLPTKDGWPARSSGHTTIDQRGLKHGFSLAERPASNSAPGSKPALLSFTLSTRGGLTPEAASDSVQFLNATGLSASCDR